MSTLQMMTERLGALWARRDEETGALGWLILGVLIGIGLVIYLIVSLIVPGD